MKRVMGTVAFVAMVVGCSSEPGAIDTSVGWPEVQTYEAEVRNAQMGVEMGNGNWAVIAPTGPGIAKQAEDLVANMPAKLKDNAEAKAKADAVVAAAQEYDKACKTRQANAIQSAHQQLMTAIGELSKVPGVTQ